MKNRLSLAPDHLADLRGSGLSDETILEARISSVRPCDIDREIGFNLPGLVSCYRIPFPPDFKYCRFKLFYASGQEHSADGSKKPKYIQRKGTSNRLYIPYGLWDLLQDSKEHLYCTEGEKKALKATQEGIPCFAICGLWNWKQPGQGLDRLIQDFDLINWRNRKLFMVPDNDWLLPGKDGKPKNLKQAVFRFCRALQARGAKTEIIMLPDGG